ncbi:MAG: hypothetical protein IPH82_21560 [Chloroflexi bacterium]|nr:hypothetical protein [Chloroflexota bacterium]
MAGHGRFDRSFVGWFADAPALFAMHRLFWAVHPALRWLAAPAVLCRALAILRRAPAVLCHAPAVLCHAPAVLPSSPRGRPFSSPAWKGCNSVI